MGPGTNSAWNSEAVSLGADTAYPDSGQNLAQSVGSVIQQGTTGPNHSTAAALAAIQYALSTNNGLVDIIAYSAGAAAFTEAYGALTPAQQARIRMIQYISPGVFGEIADPAGLTNVPLGSGSD